ncbi:unnamed protein product [Boreogadus saida]
MVVKATASASAPPPSPPITSTTPTMGSQFSVHRAVGCSCQSDAECLSLPAGVLETKAGDPLHKRQRQHLPA